MGFNKLFIPELAVLKKDLMERGNEEFGKTWINRYMKADAVIGPVDSMDFIKQFINMEYNDSKKADRAPK
jgi:hypothetical protein